VDLVWMDPQITGSSSDTDPGRTEVVWPDPNSIHNSEHQRSKFLGLQYKYEHEIKSNDREPTVCDNN